MKHLLFILLFASFGASAQKTKSFDVCKTQLAHVYGKVSFKDNVQIDTTYHVIGRDSRYQQLIQFISLYDGGLKDVYAFFKHCSEFVKTEEVGISDTYMGNQLSVGRTMGMKYINVYGIKGDSGGYTQFGAPQINNVLVGIEYFAKNHKISLK